MTKREPSHPGEILKDLYMDSLEITVSELARALNVSRKSISKIVSRHSSVTAQMALRLSTALGTTPQLWLNLQQNFDLWHALKECKLRK